MNEKQYLKLYNLQKKYNNNYNFSKINKNIINLKKICFLLYIHLLYIFIYTYI